MRSLWPCLLYTSIETLAQAEEIWKQNAVPVLLDPQGTSIAPAKPDVIVDTILYPVTAEHFYISFIEELSTDISGSPSLSLIHISFRDNGKLLFRPGGHGALIENLNDLDADIIFIKNTVSSWAT